MKIEMSQETTLVLHPLYSNVSKLYATDLLFLAGKKI